MASMDAFTLVGCVSFWMMGAMHVSKAGLFFGDARIRFIKKYCAKRCSSERTSPGLILLQSASIKKTKSSCHKSRLGRRYRDLVSRIVSTASLVARFDEAKDDRIAFWNRESMPALSTLTREHKNPKSKNAVSGERRSIFWSEGRTCSSRSACVTHSSKKYSHGCAMASRTARGTGVLEHITWVV